MAHKNGRANGRDTVTRTDLRAALSALDVQFQRIVALGIAGASRASRGGVTQLQIGSKTDGQRNGRASRETD